MSHKEIMEAYRSMQEQALEEKKLSKDQEKEMDVDDDNDIDGDDLKKLRSKKKGKEDDEMEVRVESAEELEELSKKTLGSYVKNASSFRNVRAQDDAETKKTGPDHYDSESPERSKWRMAKRKKGITKAVKKLTREELEVYTEELENELQELSKKTLGSYINKAETDMVKKSKAAGTARGNARVKDYQGQDSQKDHDKSRKLAKKAYKRETGIERATDKLTRENVEQTIDYAREKNSAASKAVQQMWQDALEENKQTAGATAPEKIDSKMSPMSKAFVAMHGMKVDNSVYPSQQTAVSAGRATSQAPARRGDKR